MGEEATLGYRRLPGWNGRGDLGPLAGGPNADGEACLLEEEAGLILGVVGLR